MTDQASTAVVPPQRFLARFEEKVEFNEKFGEYHFELVEPSRLTFKSGQYVSLKVSPEGERRSYSIVSSPSIDHGFSLMIDVSPGGKGSKYAAGLKFGDQVEVLAPMGLFTLQPPQTTATPIVMIANGSGIAPFHAMVLDLLQIQQFNLPLTLFWGMRYVQELFWLEEFRELTDHFPNFQFHPVVSKALEQWPLCRGRVTDCLSVHAIPTDADYYVCGSKEMIKDVGALLIQRGVAAPRIFHEKFF